jgi:phosphoglucosamine mutase
VAAASDQLGESGRVLVRASGTEPLVRIMVEADAQNVAESVAAELRRVVEAEFGHA